MYTYYIILYLKLVSNNVPHTQGGSGIAPAQSSDIEYYVITINNNSIIHIACCRILIEIFCVHFTRQFFFY